MATIDIGTLPIRRMKSGDMMWGITSMQVPIRVIGDGIADPAGTTDPTDPTGGGDSLACPVLTRSQLMGRYTHKWDELESVGGFGPSYGIDIASCEYEIIQLNSAYEVLIRSDSPGALLSIVAHPWEIGYPVLIETDMPLSGNGYLVNRDSLTAEHDLDDRIINGHYFAAVIRLAEKSDVGTFTFTRGPV